ncbi:hypothetical protein M409DRAFT_61412 [Zasmidium cellare ATCC 36951]|uniref:Uncharacterized protein n=1 Tax=Zasmidium cellare ATCC 36951 TaxID=1080233 RepID=A0A6A6BVN5_ZASCE|nr:uncharacterized protein M409DRAFT_61412 [Zasmidium cellare ATCC 36951]KAF2158755.1 hypothetical protein M409DRAFT_61412 [Zasmidium cellare ATCC 36951]
MGHHSLLQAPNLKAIYGTRQGDSFLFPLYAALHQWGIAARLVNVWRPITTRTLDQRRAAKVIATWTSHCALYLEEGRDQSRAQLHMQAACLTHVSEEGTAEHNHTEADIPQTSIGSLPEEILLLVIEYAVQDRAAPVEYTRYNERPGKRYEGKQPWLADIQNMGIPLVNRQWNRIFNGLVDDLTVTVSMSDWRDSPWTTTPLMVVHPKSYVALQCARRITLDCSILPLFAAYPLPTQLADILRSRECLPEMRFSAPRGPDTFLPYFPDYLPFASRTAYLRDLLEPIAAVYAARHMTFAVRVPDWGNAVQCVRASPGPLREGEWPLLLWAAYSGSRAVASLALRAQDQTLEEVLNWRNMSGETPLYMAAMQGNLDVARLLLSFEETFIDCMTSDGRNPLLCAAASGHTALVEELLLCISDRYPGQEKAQILDAREECGGTTPLIAAAIQGHDGVVAALLQAGVDSDAIDYRGYTALRAAQASNLSQSCQVSTRSLSFGETKLGSTCTGPTGILLEEP